MARGGKKGRPMVQPPPLEEAEQPPGNSLSTIDRDNHELSPRTERAMNETVQRGSGSVARPHSSYASIVDPNKGTALDFVPTS